MGLKTAIVIGAGLRGVRYTDYAVDNKDKFKVVGVADLIDERRDYMKNLHSIPEENCFGDWRDMLSRPKFADFAIVSTQDRQHFEPCMATIEAGYDILLEKPISPDPYECIEIERAAKEKGVKIMVCFVLRYGALFLAIKNIILSGKLGRVMNIIHTEGVGDIHQTHSYVRGNWRNTAESACMLLAKSSHDIDIMQWLVDSKCSKVQSFGSLSYFKAENKPEGAPERCIDGCPHADTCFYNSIKLYLEDEDNLWFREAATRLPKPTNEQVEHALRTTNYGKCVFGCDNDVVDHQVVNVEYENGATASFTMSAFNGGGRRITVMGTKGELYGSDHQDYITLHDFATRTTTDIKYTDLLKAADITGGHGGGDTGIMRDLYEYLNGTYEGPSVTPFEVSVDNHIATFAAEHSRLNGGQVVDVDEYKKAVTEGKIK